MAYLHPSKEECNSVWPVETERPRSLTGHGNGEVKYGTAVFLIPRGAQVVSLQLEFKAYYRGGVNRGVIVRKVLCIVRCQVCQVFLLTGVFTGIH